MKKILLLALIFIYIFSCALFAATKKSSKKPKKKAAKKAEQIYSKTDKPAAGAKDKKKAVILYNNAVKAHKNGDFKNAISFYNQAIKINRRFWQSWLGLGICYYNMKKYRNATLIFRYVLSLKPGQPTAKRYYSMLSGKQSGAAAKTEGIRTKGEMMWRSALLPGIGQFYNGELAKGYIYSLGYIASVAAIIKYTIDQQIAVDAYTNANYDFDAKYKAAEDAGRRVIIPIATAGAVWAISIFDAFLSGKDEPQQAKTAGIRVIDNYTVAMNVFEYRF